jgi:hypothetical protein
MKNAPQRSPSTITRCTSAFWAASFLFFLLYSAPHRVHHFFERTAPHSHDQSHNDHHQPNHHDNSAPNGSDCVFQVSASRCTIGLAAQIQPLVLMLFAQRSLVFPKSTSPEQSLAGSFQIRAPPQA